MDPLRIDVPGGCGAGPQRASLALNLSEKPPMSKLIWLSLLVFSIPAHAADDALSTVSERSGFLQTGRYDEVIALCDSFAKAYPKSVRCIDFGTSPEGRPMKALVASTSGALDAAGARERGLPVVLIQGGIHAGEIDGKDAGFLALREMLRRQGRARACWTSWCGCSCRCSAWTATNASAPGIAPTSAGPRKWAGAPPRRATTSTAIT